MTCIVTRMLDQPGTARRSATAAASGWLTRYRAIRIPEAALARAGVVTRRDAQTRVTVVVEPVFATVAVIDVATWFRLPVAANIVTLVAVFATITIPTIIISV